MYAFEYKRPQTVDEVMRLYADDVEPRFLAGGQTLLASMKHRLTGHSTLIDLQGIGNLRGIERNEDLISISAMTCHADVAASEVIREAIPALAVLAGCIGDPSVRNMGTIGGSVANNDPAADYPGAVVGLGASIETDRRTIAADDFFIGMFATALQSDELIRKIHFPIPKRAGYFKFPDSASGYVLVGAFVSQFERNVRVAINGAADKVFRLGSLETTLEKNFNLVEFDAHLPDAEDLIDDPRSPATYKRALIKPVLQKALTSAIGQYSNSKKPQIGKG